MSTIYLVTGAGRGIGFALIEQLATRSNVIVVAGVRSLPLKPDEQLAILAAKLPAVVFPIELKSAVESSNHAAAKIIQERFGKVDVIIANAGVSSGMATISTVNASQIKTDFETNTLGPIILFQAFQYLLAASDASGGAKFVVISSILGQIKDSAPYSYDAYGISKAAVNFVAKKIDQETPGVISFPVHPGAVSTDMGNAGAALLGTTIEAFGGITPPQSAHDILAIVDRATKEQQGGKFWNHTGEELTY